MNKLLRLLFLSFFLQTGLEAAYCQEPVSSPIQEGMRIRVATHNMLFEYKVPKQEERRWANRLEAIKELYDKYNVDIIGSQELLGWQGEEFMKTTGYAATGANQIGYPEGHAKARKTEYERIFYKAERFELVREGHFWFSEAPDVPTLYSWDADHTRMCSWARFKEKSTGMEFFVFNSHFHYNAAISRYESAKLLLSRIRIIANGMPVLCTGDFNGRITSEAISLIADSGIVYDSRSLAGENVSGPAFSCHGFNPEPTDLLIDHIFVSKDIKVDKYRIVDDELKTGRFCSDHLPVIIDVTLEKK